MTNRILFIFLIFSFILSSVKAQELVLNSGHSDEVNDVAISPDGLYALSGSKDKTIKLWNVATGKEIRTFIGHTEPVEAVAFSPDGKCVLSGGGTIVRSEMYLWDIATGKIIRAYPNHTMTVYDIAFSPDGNYILSASADHKVKLWNTNTGEELKTFEGHEGWVFAVKFSPDGKYAVSGANNEANTIIVWDIEKGKRVKSFKDKTINSVSLDYSPDGNKIISGSVIYDATNGKELTILGGQAKVSRTVSYSHDGTKILASFFEKSFKMWNAETGMEIREFKGHAEEVRSVVFSKDEKYALSGSKDKTLKLWDIESGKEIKTFTGQSPTANSFTYAGLYALRNSSNIKTQLAEFIKTYTSGNWYETSPDGKYLLKGSKNDAIICKIPSNEIIQTFSGHSKTVTCVAYTPDGKHILTGSEDKTIKLWDTKTAQELNTFTGHQHFVKDIAVSNDGKYAASCSYDNMIKLWDLYTGKEIRTLKGHNSFVYSIKFGPQNKTLLSGSLDKTAILWDISTGNMLKTFKGHDQGINTVAISHNNKYVLTGSDENIIKLWDKESAKEMHTFTGHSHGIRSIKFAPDNKHFISASSDGIFKLWNIETKKCLATYWAQSQDIWACYTPEGLFDGSPEGIKLFHFVKGMDILPLDNLFEKYFTPGLLGIIAGEGKQEKVAVEINKLKPAPTIEIISPKNGKRLLDKTVTIELECIDKGGGIDEIRLFHNNKLIQSTERGFKKVAKEHESVIKNFTLQLVNGENIFKATAFNNERTESIPDEITIFYEGQKPKSNLHILAIGINQYKNQKYNLNYAVKDAQAFVDQIQFGAADIFGEENTYFIKDNEAIKSAIINKLQEIKEKAKQEDVVIFYFAGHGVMSEGSTVANPEFFLVPHNVTQLYGNDEMLKKSAISAIELMEISREIKAQKQLFVFDACQSGGATKTFAMRGAAEEKAMAQLARSAGIVVLSASGTEQFATEFNDLGHGTFTYALIEGLQCKADGGNKDRKITVNELKAWIEDRVPELTEKYKGTAQYPTGYSRGQDFPIVICK